MASRKDNLKALMNNARTRVIILFTVVILVFGILLGLSKFFKNTSNVSGAAGLKNAPTDINATPGSVDQTAEYARLQNLQNKQNAQLALSKGTSSIPTIVDLKLIGNDVTAIGPQQGTGGVGFSTLANLGQGSQKPLWLQDLASNNCDRQSLTAAVNNGASMEQLKESCSCEQLKDFGMNLSKLSTVCGCSQLRQLGTTAFDLKKIGYDAEKLRVCGFSACELKAAGFSANDMKNGGYSDGELSGAGYSPDQIALASGIPNGMTAAQIKAAGCGVDALKKLRAEGVSAAAIRRISGCDLAALKAAGFTASELKDAGYTPAELRAAGFSADDLKKAGFSPKQLLDAGFTPDDLAKAGFSPQDIANALNALPEGITAADIRANGCSIDALKKEHAVGVSAAAIMRISGCSLSALKAAGYSPAELGAAGTQSTDGCALNPIINAACDVNQLSQLRGQGVTAALILAVNHCSPLNLKNAGFNVVNLLSSGVGPEDLLKIGVTSSDIDAAYQKIADPVDVSDNLISAANCDAIKISQLKRFGVSAAKIEALNHCSPQEFRAACFSAGETLGAGFTADELITAGFTSAEIQQGQKVLDNQQELSDTLIKNAACNEQKISELRELGVTAAKVESLNHCNATTIRAAGYCGSDLLAAGFSVNELASAGFNVNQIQAAQNILAGITSEKCQDAQNVSDAAIKAAGCDPEKLAALRKNGVSAAQIIKLNNCSAAALKAAGFTAKDLLDAGLTPADLAAAGFTPDEIAQAQNVSDAGIKAAGCDPAKLAVLRKNGVSAAQIIKLNNCSAAALKAAGFTAKDLLDAGLTPADLAAAGYTPDEIAQAQKDLLGALANAKLNGCSVATATAARKAGLTATELRKTLGCSAATLLQAGYTPAELKAAGFTPGELARAGVSLPDLLKAGFTPGELKAAGFSAADLKNAGVSPADLLAAGFKPDDLLAAGITPDQLLAAGIKPDVLKRLGLNAAALKNAGLSPSQLKDAGFTHGDLQQAGFNQNDLQSAGLSPNVDPFAKVAGLSSSLASAPGAFATKPDNAGIDNLNTALQEQKKMQAALKFQQKIQQKTSGMLSYSSQLIQGWKEVSTQSYVAGDQKDKNKLAAQQMMMPAAGNKSANPASGDSSDSQPELFIKSGDILFAIIDTAINTDEPSPILATIVTGALKGTKLIGSFNLPSNADKMVITFTSMSVQGITQTIGISAYAIDPNTGRTALSSSTNHHYLERYGALFASTFLEGFGNAFQSADTTITIGGTGGTGGPNTTTVQNGIGRSLTSNAVIGLATLGKAWGQQAQQNMNIPTTVQVYSGTPIGVLFLQDVTVNPNQSK